MLKAIEHTIPQEVVERKLYEFVLHTTGWDQSPKCHIIIARFRNNASNGIQNLNSKKPKS